MTDSSRFQPPPDGQKVTPDRSLRTLPGFGGIIWLGVIAFCTLRPSSPSELAGHKEVPWDCLVCGSGGSTDVFLNLLLFFPLGILANRMNLRPLRTIMYGMMLSMAIELIQAGWLAGRDPTVSDVLSNTLGIAIGWFVANALFSGARPFRSRAPKLALGMLGLHLLVWWGAAWGLQPALTGPTPWWAYYTQIPAEDSARYGDVIAATYAGVPLSPMKYHGFPFTPNGEQLTMTLNRTAEIPEGRVARLRVKQADSGQIVTVDQTDDELMLGLRLRVTKYLFRTPNWEFFSAVDTSSLNRKYTWTWDGPQILMTTTWSDGSNAQRVSTLPFRITYGWALIHPFVTRIGKSAQLWSTLWLLWWFGALGALSAWCSQSMRAALGVIALALFYGAGAYAGWPVTLVEIITATGGYVALMAIGLTIRRKSEGRTS